MGRKLYWRTQSSLLFLLFNHNILADYSGDGIVHTTAGIAVRKHFVGTTIQT
jgi:hypothetical protein